MGPRLKFDYVFEDFACIFGKNGAEKRSLQA